MSNIEFANLVKKYRALQNVRLVDLSEKTKLSITSLTKIEKTGSCLLRTKVAIAKALEFTQEDFEKIVN